MNEKNNDILPRRFKDKRFYSADRWLKDNLGEKTIKLAIDGGFTLSLIHISIDPFL